MTALIPGADPWSHVGDGPHGALVIHGLTSTPASMRGVADALAGAGFHIELPLLPGHGTVVEDLVPIRWADWVATVSGAYRALADRCDKVVVVGLSLGGALALRMGADHPETAGLVCINPAAMPQSPEIVELLQTMIAGGDELMPGIGSDIADPDAKEVTYDATPLSVTLSLVVDGLNPLGDEYPGMNVPLLLLTSPQDHVVEPAQGDYLAANYGGPLERISLERSYHVATQDYDKQLIHDATVAFAQRVTG
jgi:carboxylesterase